MIVIILGIILAIFFLWIIDVVIFVTLPIWVAYACFLIALALFVGSMVRTWCDYRDMKEEAIKFNENLEKVANKLCETSDNMGMYTFDELNKDLAESKEILLNLNEMKRIEKYSKGKVKNNKLEEYFVIILKMMVAQGLVKTERFMNENKQVIVLFQSTNPCEEPSNSLPVITLTID